MLQHILNVLEPASSVALISLEDAKLQLNIPASDASKDVVLMQLIEQTSDVLAVLANRVFVYERVMETFHDINNGEKRLFFSRWPVKVEDIEELTADGNDIIPDLWPPEPPIAPPTAANWVIEQDTGTLYRPMGGAWSGTVNAVYSGGYQNPDEVPPALKQAAAAILREGYYAMLRGAMLSGVRMIAHKQARVMYYPQGQAAGSTTSTGGQPASTGVAKAIDAVLMKYVRHWI